MNTQTASNPAASAVLNNEALKNIDTASKPIVVRPRVARALLVRELVNAAGSFKQAINAEIAVCLAIFAQDKGVNVGSKKELYAVYKEAGYDCSVGGKGRDYKTVNRRIGYAGQFYNSLKKGTVEAFMGDETTDAVALASIINHLTTEYNFRSMNDVLNAAGVVTQRPVKKAAAPAPAPQKPALPEKDQKVVAAAQARVDAGKAPTKPQAKLLEKHGLTLAKAEAPAPAPQAPAGPTEGDQGVMAAMAQEGKDAIQRRLQDSDKWVRMEFRGATIIVPVDMTHDDFAQLGIELMTLSNHMKGDKVDAAVLKDAFKQTESH